jgi:hypothetical protein
LVVVHVSVELAPAAIEVGFAAIAAVVTFTVACPQSVSPAALWAVMREVVVVVGDTDCDPFNGTDVPLRSAVVAF